MSYFLFPLGPQTRPIMLATATSQAPIVPLSPFARSLRIAVFFLVALLLGVLLAQSPAFAGAAPANEVEAELDTARKRMDELQAGLADQTDDAEFIRRRSAALEVQAKADSIAETLAPQLTSVEARLGELGTVEQGTKEASDVAAQRAQLEKSRVALDAQVKLARLLSVEGGQAADQIATLRRAQFQARMGERRPSVMGPRFWREFRSDLPRDISRLSRLSDELTAVAVATPIWMWGAIAAAIAAVLALRLWVGRWLLRLTSTRVPPGRVRRSLRAITLVLLATITPGLALEAAILGLSANYAFSNEMQGLLQSLVGTACFAGFVAGLGHALLSPSRPTWRLLPIPDEVALRMRSYPLALAVMIVGGWLIERLPVLVNASLSSTIAINCIVALTLGLIIAVILLRTERARKRVVADPDDNQRAARPFWLLVVVGLIWLTLAVSLVSILAGYVAFGAFVVKQLLWSVVVLSSAYLLSVLVEDGFTTLLSSASQESDGDQSAERTPKARDQAAVLMSGLGRLFVVLFALVLIAAPFGEGPLELLQRADQIHQGLNVGEIQIRPGAVLQALLVLLACLIGVRVLKSWLGNRLLPTTSLDPGMRLSATTLFGYAGVVLSVALAMSAVGVGLERVAWVASALSVGIGFGLQAVVQNFVSGLILLAERPVKVGDWVSLGGVEGDIQRINVRATEIQMGDRSTVIVPNSEFITKTVRNVTHSNPLGLVQIKLPMPLNTDAPKVRSLMLEAFEAHPDILESPAPNVFLDAIDGTNLVFNATGFVSSPRAAYGVRSALLFEVLQRVNGAGMSMVRQPTMLLGSMPGAPVAPPISAADPETPPLAKE